MIQMRARMETLEAGAIKSTQIHLQVGVRRRHLSLPATHHAEEGGVGRITRTRGYDAELQGISYYSLGIFDSGPNDGKSGGEMVAK